MCGQERGRFSHQWRPKHCKCCFSIIHKLFAQARYNNITLKLPGDRKLCNTGLKLSAVNAAHKRILCSPDYKPDPIYEGWLLPLHATMVRIPRSDRHAGGGPGDGAQPSASERPAVMTGAPQSGLECREEPEHVISRGGEPARVSWGQGLKPSAADQQVRD